MSKRNDDFFREKKLWSQVKDELLACYLRPYMQKILSTHKPIVYVDCFAGKGIFEDGKWGSPLIALNIIKTCICHSKVKSYSLRPYFIDKNYSEDLEKNLSSYKDLGITIIQGKYENVIDSILEKNVGSNVFLYVDPYGINALNQNKFSQLSNSNKFNSVELLINLNSYGFIREGCRVLGVSFEEEALFEDLIEYETTKLEKNDKSIEVLNNIAGGDYWQEIIHRKNLKEIDTKEAECCFADMYCKQMQLSYKYVLNMPIRIKKGHSPKYRMVYATNHIMGFLIMVNNICNRWEVMRNIQTGGQMSFFNEDVNNNIIDDGELMEKVQVHLMQYRQFERLNFIMADFFMKNGPICSTKDLVRMYKYYEKCGNIIVERQPKITSGTKQPSVFFTEDKNKIVKMRWQL